MTETCQFHKEVEQMLKDNQSAIEGRISKGSLKAVSVIFAVPLTLAILGLYAFVMNADYKYGSQEVARTNAANIKLLDERTITIKNDIVRMQSDISNDLAEIKRDVKSLGRELSRDNTPRRGGP